MDRKVMLQAATFAALLAVVCMVVMAFASRLPDRIKVQPSRPPVPVQQFVCATNEHTDNVLTFFAADSLFVVSYLLVFVGLYVVTAARARPFALLGLGAGIVTALCDALENAFFITYALLKHEGIDLKEPHLPLIFLVANLKWMGAFCALFAFGLVFPRTTWLEQLIMSLLVLSAVAGLPCLALPPGPDWVELAVLLPSLANLLLLTWYFWQQARAVKGTRWVEES